MMDEIKTDAPFNETTQKALLSHLSTELETAIKNNKKINEDFETFYNMIHSIRNKKPNDWESDISLPEFSSRLLTQISNFCAQYFSSTDYVESSMDSDEVKDVAESKAAKKLLNTLLKDPDAHYYHKIVRLINFVFTCGYGIIKGGYTQKINKVVSHMNQKSEIVIDPETGDYVAEDGSPFIDPIVQKPSFNVTEEPVYADEVEIDTPTFDVYPIQNVYQSSEYTYTLNDKEYVIFETEKTLTQLKSEAEQMGYFNLDFLEADVPEGKRGEKTYNKDGTLFEQPDPIEKVFIEYERWGKYPVKEKDGKYVPAIDDNGKFEPDAELAECMIHYIQHRESDSPRYIIGFHKSNHTRRPMVKFLCYVDMVNDNGFGDGAVNRELQIASDDNYNLMNFRTRLSITPAFKGKRFSGIPEKINISPEHVTLVENLTDLEQWVINDNIQGGIFHQNLLASRMDYSMATSPQTMGMSSERAETATAASITNQRANLRLGMKTMNLEFIGFDDFYRMLLTLCNDFMLPETLEKLVGKELALAYNPKRKDKFRPVSQALESEESKATKLKTWQGLYSMSTTIPNPKTPMFLNYIMGQMLELMGGDFKTYKKFMLEEDPDTMLLYQLATGSKSAPQQAPPQAQAPPSNQAGLPQQPAEQMTRERSNG